MAKRSNTPPRAYYSGKVKALDGGRIRGPIVLFGDAKTTDLVTDYFTDATDYGIAERLPVYYQHGFDQVMGRKRLAVTPVLKASEDDEEFGLWAEYQLDLSDRYQAHLHDMASEGKMGHSSGAVGHLVERKAMPNGSHHVTMWPLAELSLTPEPAEPRMMGRVVPVKAFRSIKSIFAGTTFSKTTTAAGITVPVTVDLSIRTNTETMKNNNAQDPAPKHLADAPSEGDAPDVGATLKAMQALIEKQNARLEALAAKSEAQPAQPAAPQGDGSTPAAQPDYKAIVKEVLEESQKAFEPQRQVWTPQAPAYVKTPGDSWQNAFTYWVATGDIQPLRHMQPTGDDSENGPWKMNRSLAPFQIALKASNATAMLAGTDAAGGAAVPQGHVNTIVARRDEMALWRRLGCMEVPGTGLTVHLPVDNEDNGEFVSTSERAANDMDSPALDTRAFTLVKYTKRVPITDELVNDETSGLLAFIENFVGRGAAKTENNLLITEVAASGTSFVTFASSIDIASGEVEAIVADDDLGNYLDDSPSVNWVTRHATYYNKILTITGNDRLYAEQALRSASSGPTLLGYPVHMSQKVTAIGAQANPNAKAVYFGNWFYVGVRHDPEMRILRDPFSEAANGTVNLHYYFRTVYKVIHAEAVGYGAGAAS